MQSGYRSGGGGGRNMKAQHGVGPGHGHRFETPGDFGSGHGGRGEFYAPGSLPEGWGNLPAGVDPIHPVE